MSDASSATPERTPGKIILAWWSRNLGNRELSGPRALAARLRRATGVDALTEPEVHELASALHLFDGETLRRLVGLLAHVREHDSQTLARRPGGSEPVLSTLRFQRLMRAEGDELTESLRRALAMAEGKCNVAALGQDLLRWNDRTRQTWCFHYFGEAAPQEGFKEMTE